MGANGQIFIPDTVLSIPHSQELYFRGFIYYFNDQFKIYITSFSTSRYVIQNPVHNKSEDIIIGHTEGNELRLSPNPSTIFVLQKYDKIKLTKLVYKGAIIDVINCIQIMYDYKEILKSEIPWEPDDNFSKLQSLILQENNETRKDATDELKMYCPTWMKCSKFIQHFVNYINILLWAATTLITQRKITIKHGNLALSLLLDLFLGYIVLKFLIEDRRELGTYIMTILEKLINMLYSLLKWLMGAPAGLKLNNAFNKMLGKYFSYHVQLWWLFLDVSGEKLGFIIDIFCYLGYLGFTFQAAVVSDMICVATFHSYCIYVYAARLFNIQVSGLIALLRFFVGRKYNPLRETIDSCEYTNQELFVGTVAFTILLLLLPTTAMYYIVFTMFRMLSLLMLCALDKIIYALHTLPLYVIGLWLIRSPRVAGNVILEVIGTKERLTLKLKVLSKSIFTLVKIFRPPVEAPKRLEWGNILSNVFIGRQII